MAANMPNNNQSIVLLLLNPLQTYKTDNAQKGSWQTFTFNPEFRKISPFSKIPVIIDHENNKEAVFESGAVLMYLGEKSNKFYEKKDRTKINQWLMAQMGYVGPMLGQHHQFHRYNSGKDKWGEERYFKITKTIYGDLDERLGQSKYLAGENYSIADIATFPWIARHDWHDIGLKNYKNLTRWFLRRNRRANRN